jgi:hypothetical protein
VQTLENRDIHEGMFALGGPDLDAGESSLPNDGIDNVPEKRLNRSELGMRRIYEPHEESTRPGKFAEQACDPLRNLGWSRGTGACGNVRKGRAFRVCEGCIEPKKSSRVAARLLSKARGTTRPVVAAGTERQIKRHQWLSALQIQVS